MVRYLIKREYGDVEVLLMRHKDGSGWSFVNITKGHICPCKFPSFEAAVADCLSREETKQMIKLPHVSE